MRKYLCFVLIALASTGCAGTKTAIVVTCTHAVDPDTSVKLEYRVEESHAPR